MTHNVDITPVTIQINGRILGKFCPIFQIKSRFFIFFPIINLPNTN